MIEPWPPGMWPAPAQKQTCIVVGGGLDAFDERDRALALRPDADVWGVNLVPLMRPGFMRLVTLHYEVAQTFRELHRALWGDDIRIDAGPPTTSRTDPLSFDGIDQWWINHIGSATSAPFAAQVARQGYRYAEVILAGAPLEPDGECITPEIRQRVRDRQHAKGLGMEHAERGTRNEWSYAADYGLTIQAYQRAFKKHANAGLFAGCYSMSGFTRDVLGPPQ